MDYSKIKKAGIFLGICLCVSAGGLRAQSISQLIEQLALDVQKLSELRSILKEMYTGYEVIDKGYTNVRDIVKGNFNLHKAFLDGLLAVSPSVRQYYRAGLIIEMQGKIIREYQAAFRVWGSSGLFSAGELAEIGRVYGGLSKQSGNNLDRLAMVITDAELRMSDAERIKTIDGIYGDVLEQLGGLRRYNDELSIALLQRGKESKTINLLKKMYDNP